MPIDLGKPPAAVRNPLVAQSLNFLFPGSGHLYWGDRQTGLSVSLGLVFSSCALIAFWFSHPLYPIPLIWAFVSLWFLLGVGLLVHFRHLPPSGVLRHPLASPTPPLVYLLCALGGISPIFLGYFIFRVTFILAPVTDTSMFPQLLHGDQVLVDQRAYLDRSPLPGDLVAFYHDQRLCLARVIAIRETGPIELEGGVPSAPSTLTHLELSDLELPHLRGLDRTRFRRSIGYLEEVKSKSYPVFYARYPKRPYPSHHARALDPDSVYVLPDNRDALRDQRTPFGEIPLREIIGRPLYVFSHLPRSELLAMDPDVIMLYQDRAGLPIE